MPVGFRGGDPPWLNLFYRTVSFRNAGFHFLKRSVGYKYNSEPGILSRFDRYLAVNYPQADALSKEAVTGWCSKTMHETAANHCSRASVIRQFSKYLSSIGIRAWILPKNYYPTGQRYVPHIYTLDELRRFLQKQISVTTVQVFLTGI